MSELPYAQELSEIRGELLADLATEKQCVAKVRDQVAKYRHLRGGPRLMLVRRLEGLAGKHRLPGGGLLEKPDLAAKYLARERGAAYVRPQ